MAPKSKKQKEKQKQTTTSPSPLKKYENMTLDELSQLDDAHDEEIDEYEAFNSEDEKVYGKYFSDEEIDSRKAFNSEDEKKYGKYFSSSAAAKMLSKNLSLSIPLQHDTVRVVEIGMGSKMTLSSICLDVSVCDFEQIKVMFRCTKSDDFACLSNYLSAKKGGMGLMPSTPVNLEVAGPCKVEFKAEIAPTAWVGGGINIFGVIAATDNGGDLPFDFADAFLSDEEEVVSDDNSVEEDTSEMKSIQDKADGEKSKGLASKVTKKRKLEKEVKEKPSQPSASKATPTDQQSNDANEDETKNEGSSATKLSKKQRKKLAQEKAKQLEETLSAARNDTNDDEGTNDEEPAKKKSKKKKNKKQSKDETSDTLSKPTSMTRERRLAGGLIVSDLLLGAGAPVKPGKRISLHYTGTLRSSGKVFDKNHSKQHPLVFRQGTGEVIRGLERGLDGMKVGGERVISVPSNLGYGKKGSGLEIPPDSDLVFEVKVLKVG